ncbi:MAG: hypothetical protein RI907_614 [Pseudomonadota bacterium]|jgi:dienelactone hydrolase
MKNAQARLTVLAASVAALTMSVAAQAATVGPNDDSFYTAPSTPVAGEHGTLISYRKATVNLGKDAPGVTAWNVLYKSQDSDNFDNTVSGTILTPAGGNGNVLVYAVGTHGLAAKCAPSRQMAAGTDYEANNINAALKAGYTVLVSDYAGYIKDLNLEGQLADGVPTYLAGKSQGHAVLDLVRAARQLSGSGVTASSKVGIWGFSQGGQTAGWAAETHKAYTPETNIVGIAGGGIPANFINAAYLLDGSIGAAFLAGGVVGLNAQYPETLNIDLIASEAGFAALDKLKTQCVFEALLDLQNKSLTAFTTGNIGLDQILKIKDIRDTLNAQNLGSGATSVPLYLFHGQADEFIGIDQTTTLKNTYCAAGNKNVQFDLYPSEHIVTMTQGAGPALAWMADRFGGKAAPNNCSIKTVPTSTSAVTKGGDLIVKLDGWKLNATMHLKTLNQDIVLPDTSTLTVTSNITKASMTGSMNVPEFKARVTIIGIGAQTGVRVTPVGQVTGSTTLDKNGTLAIKGTAQADITVTSVWGIPFGECKTVSPVTFPLNYSGPVGDLGAGKVTFAGTADIPQIKGCFISGILSALMTAKGNGFNFQIAPQAPKSTY